MSPAAPPQDPQSPQPPEGEASGSHADGIYSAGFLEQLHFKSSHVAGSASPLLECGSDVERVIPPQIGLFTSLLFACPYPALVPLQNLAAPGSHRNE